MVSNAKIDILGESWDVALVETASEEAVAGAVGYLNNQPGVNATFRRELDPILPLPENLDRRGGREFIQVTDTAAAQEAVDELRDLILDIVNTTKFDQPFPEDSFEGMELRAYDYIVERLGKAPKDDRGETLTPGSLVGIQRPPDIDEESWTKVFEHLKNELTYFQFAKDWAGLSTGHMFTLASILYLQSFNTTEAVAQTYFDLGEKESSIEMKAVIALISLALGRTGPLGQIAASILGVIWAAVESRGDTSLRGTVARLQIQLTTQYGHMIDGIEEILRELRGNWGKLEKFGLLVAEGELRWPDDTRPIRRASLRQWHIELMKVFMKVTEIGVLDVMAESPSLAKERLDRNGYFYFWPDAMPYRKGRYFQFLTSMGTAGVFRFDLNRKINNKLFGIERGGTADPELRLDHLSLYLDNAWDLRKYTFDARPKESRLPCSAPRADGDSSS